MNNFYTTYAVRAFAIGGYLASMMTALLGFYLVMGAQFILLAERFADFAIVPLACLLVLAIEVFTFACAFSSEKIGQAMLKHPFENQGYGKPYLEDEDEEKEDW